MNTSTLDPADLDAVDLDPVDLDPVDLDPVVLDPVVLPGPDELAAMSAHDAAVWFQHLDQQRRRLDAALVEVIGAAEIARHHTVDGHRSVSG